MQTCTKCLVRRQYGEFWKASHQKNGLRTWCKECVRKSNRIAHRRESFLEKSRIYQKKRRLLRKTVPKLRIDKNMSQATWRSLKKGKGGKSWTTIVGYSAEQLMNHLQNQFDENMSWDNYGSYWEVDHIKPISSFNYQTVNDKDFKECWGLSNLQPLEARENSSKKASLTWQKAAV